MQTLASPGAPDPVDPRPSALIPSSPPLIDARPLYSLPRALARASGAIVLIGSEIWLVAALMFWALLGFVGTSLPVEAVLGVLIGGPAVWATWQIIILAVAAERVRDDQDA
ncbi:hypothetical protein [Pseudohoeflea coraliihabitans]|uniref:DUF4282 domain-containing protein n=1 Tax=Pseudohoeflea coraliihabitans TaxID=2860393 RepID=A0ABS6WTF1_9HYPH|nr:hypothetical protein [Pseudohoeflea sp. DP4N28-3]MBW3098697.1 hypothetical protein [Pseudohoeflea sp. DP4N28-3]